MWKRWKAQIYGEEKRSLPSTMSCPGMIESLVRGASVVGLVHAGFDPNFVDEVCLARLLWHFSISKF